MLESFALYQDVLDFVNASGVTKTLVKELTPEIYSSVMKNWGYSEIVSDLGVRIGWVRGTNLVEMATGATAETTGTGLSVVSATTSDIVAADALIGDVVTAEGSLIAENVASAVATDVTVSEVAFSGTTAGATSIATGLTLTPKVAIVCAVAGAIGLSVGFDLGQDIVDKMFFDDEQFDWRTDSIGGKIITYLTRDGKTYVKGKLIDRIKDYILSNYQIGTKTYFNPTKAYEGTYSNYNNFPIFKNLRDFLIYIRDNSYAGAVCAPVINGYLEESYLPSDDLGGITIVELSNSPTATGYRLYLEIWSFNKSSMKGTLSHQTGNVGSSSNNPVYEDMTSGDIELQDCICNYIRAYWETSMISMYFFKERDTSKHEAFPFHLINIFRGWGSGGSDDTNLYYINIGTPGYVPEYIPTKPDATIGVEGTDIGNTYPNWKDNSRKLPKSNELPADVNNPDDFEDYYPISLPSVNPENKSQADMQSGTNTAEDNDNQTREQNKIISEIDAPIENDVGDPPAENIGEPSPIVAPTSGSNSGLIKIYNPTLQTLASFSQWLWSNNIFDNFSKFFQDPMQAIIGLNLLYATPTRGADSNIILGNLDSNISSRTVSNQYIDIDCGSVEVKRYFNNVLDYINTTIELYLPFVGIVDVDAKELIGRSVNIKATVDVLTGALLYNIYVSAQNRSGIIIKQLLYTFNGNCSVQLPLSGANYTQVYATIAGLIGNIAKGAAMGGVGGALVSGIGTGVSDLASGGFSHEVQRSGSLGSNVGAMGVKIPYMIIKRNRSYNPEGYNRFYGYPSNTKVKLRNCTGFTLVKDTRISGITATEGELNEIESLLKEGIII